MQQSPHPNEGTHDREDHTREENAWSQEFTPPNQISLLLKVHNTTCSSHLIPMKARTREKSTREKRMNGDKNFLLLNPLDLFEESLEKSN